MSTHQPLYRRTARRSRDCSRERAGSVTLEFLLVLPILLIVLLAVVEFGMFFANMQQVDMACRIGAEAASQSTSLPYGLTTVPPDVADAVNQQLLTAGISPCRLILEHNVLPTPQTLTTTYVPGCGCDPPVAALPVIPARSVRMTVCVAMSELAPNCLALFGFDLTGCFAQCSTTFRYELSTP